MTHLLRRDRRRRRQPSAPIHRLREKKFQNQNSVKLGKTLLFFFSSHKLRPLQGCTWEKENEKKTFTGSRFNEYLMSECVLEHERAITQSNETVSFLAIPFFMFDGTRSRTRLFFPEKGAVPAKTRRKLINN